MRLHQVSYSFQAHKETGRGVAANRLAGIAGFAPSDLPRDRLPGGGCGAAPGLPAGDHQRAGPAVAALRRRGADAGDLPGAPLLPGHLLAIGVTSYDGKVFYGITADRDAVPDADVLGQCLAEALDELLDTVSGTRPRVPRGRGGPSAPRGPATRTSTS